MVEIIAPNVTPLSKGTISANPQTTLQRLLFKDAKNRTINLYKLFAAWNSRSISSKIKKERLGKVNSQK